MIDSLAHADCIRKSGDCYTIAVAPATPQFELLGQQQHRSKIARWESCPCCVGRASPMLANFLVHQRVILLDVRLLYCVRTGTMVLTEEERQRLSARYARIGSDRLVRSRSRRVGIGRQISEPVLSPQLANRLMSGRADALSYSSKADALVLGPACPDRLGQLQRIALLFHSVALPDRITLKIEPTTHCNFSCGFCYGRHLAQGTLSAESFWRVLDRFGGLSAIEITGEGEPLINKDIYGFISGCASRGLWSHVTTNGSLLNVRNCERLVQSGLSSLAVSVESFEPDQFARLREGGRLSQVTGGLRRLAKMREALGSSLEIRLWVTLLKSTLDQVPDIKKFAENNGVDVLEFQALNPMPSYSRFYGPELRDNMLSAQEMQQIRDDPNTHPDLRTALVDTLSYYRRRCDVFMNTTMVDWRGEVTPCCLLKAPDTRSLGNLNITSFEDIWSSDDFVFFRFALQHGIVLQPCDGCPSVALH